MRVPKCVDPKGHHMLMTGKVGERGFELKCEFCPHTTWRQRYSCNDCGRPDLHEAA